MAVIRLFNKNEYMGTAAEMADFTDVAPGAKFIDKDTGEKSLWNGSAWITDTEETVSLGGSTAIIGKVGIDQVTANANEVVTKTGSVTTATLSEETTKKIGTIGIDQVNTGANEVAVKSIAAGTNNIGKVDLNSNLISSATTIEIQTHFAKNTEAGTEQTAVQIPKPSSPILMYKAAMANPSIDSPLTVKLFNRRTFNETGTAQAGSDATHIVLSATANPTDDHYNGAIITITGGTGSGQSRTIDDYVGATVTAEVTAWDVTPDATSAYSIALSYDSLVWTGNFAKASLTAPIVKANDSDIITGLFDSGCDVYYVVSNDVLIVDADASRFTAVFQLIPIA